MWARAREPRGIPAQAAKIPPGVDAVPPTIHPEAPGIFDNFLGSWPWVVPNPCSVSQGITVPHLPSSAFLCHQVLPDPHLANQRKRIKINPALNSAGFNESFILENSSSMPRFSFSRSSYEPDLISTTPGEAVLLHSCFRNSSKSTGPSRLWRAMGCTPTSPKTRP